MPTQPQRREAALAAIMEAARAGFAAHGFDQTSIDVIAGAAGMTKGTVYHYFETKEALFQRVLEAEYDDLAPRVLARALEEPEPANQLKLGLQLFLEHCLDPSVRQILVIDGPSVLGWELWREIDARYFLGVVEAGLAALLPPERDARALAHLLIGAVDEAVMVVARAPDPGAATTRLAQEIGYLVDAVLP